MISLQQSIKICTIEKAFNISDRAPRSEFWWFFLFLIIFDFASQLFIEIVVGKSSLIFIIVNLYLTICAITSSIRRLHDVNRRGFWLLLPWAPLLLLFALNEFKLSVSLLLYICSFVFIGASVYVIVLTMLRGTKGANRFGKDPLDKSDDSIADNKINLDMVASKQIANNVSIENAIKIDEPAITSKGYKLGHLPDQQISIELANDIRKINQDKLETVANNIFVHDILPAEKEEAKQGSQVNKEILSSSIAKSTLFRDIKPLPQEANLECSCMQTDDYTLDEEIPLNYQKVDGFTLFGKVQEVKSWKDFFTKTLQVLLESNYKQFDLLFNNEDCFFDHDNGEKDLIKLDSSHYVCCINSSEDYIHILRTLFDSFKIDYSELVLKFKPKDNTYTPQKSLSPNETEISLADDVDMTFAKINSFYLFGKKYECNKFAYVYRKTVKEVVRLYPKQTEPLFHIDETFCTKKKDGVEYYEVAQNRFIRRAVSNKEKWRRLRNLFKEVGLPESELVVIVCNQKSNNS